MRFCEADRSGRDIWDVNGGEAVEADGWGSDWTGCEITGTGGLVEPAELAGRTAKGDTALGDVCDV